MINSGQTTAPAPKHSKQGVLDKIRDGVYDAHRCDVLLHEAIAGGDVTLVAALLADKASAHSTSHGGATPLHLVTRANCSDAVKREMATLLLDAGANPNVGDERGYTPLHYASFYGTAGMCRFLVESGAQINIRDQRRNTPLHWGIKSTQARPVVQALLDMGAQVGLRNADNQTPVEVALNERRDDALDVLQKFISTRHAGRVKRLSRGRRRRTHSPL